jgi:adenine-specific DNA-methyltransferase
MAYRYLGNKARMTSWLLDCISAHVEPGSVVADPMCGTAAVSATLAGAGYRVAASDSLRFPVLHAKARLLLSDEPPFHQVGGYQAAIDQLNELPPQRGFFWSEYSIDGRPRNGSKPRAYFTGANAARIDALRSTIASWGSRGCLTDAEHELLLHDLILAVNDVASIAGTYGYYRSSFGSQARAPIRIQRSKIPNAGTGHTVAQGRVEDLASSIVADACYLDPPYTKRQYAGNYHILETIALEDFPEPVGAGGLRDWYADYSSFCSKVTVEGAFRSVMEALPVRHVFLSYSEDGLLPVERLVGVLSEHGSVARYEFPSRRYTSNGAGKRGPISELLFHVDRRDS